MTTHNKKQFGVWMDTHNATVAVKRTPESKDFVILGHVLKPDPEGNSNEHAANNQKITLTHKFFKEIAALMPNVDEIHVTGTGKVQEEFIHFLADRAQYRNTVTSESTSIKMGDEQLVAFFGRHFN